ncbi:MAG: carbamate kinase [Sphaerochaetaceae bacterium]|nr:carbamate kinase [Sphaerochaetaceae bacterium]
MAKIVIALGGNALGNTPAEQLELVRETAKPIVDLIQDGNEVVIAHGNGPQVGMINLGMSTAAEAKAIKSDMPFPECGAMSQGYIGYHLQNAIGNELKMRGVKKEVVTVVTQVLVDEKDKAFQNPTKPVGAFYDKETAERLREEKGFTMVEDAGRGYRRVVPSPKPIDVIEKDSVKQLIDGGFVVITVGGGGIPVVRKDGLLYGTPAVIDKDFASEKLAELIDADKLVILTAVPKVAVNYRKPDEAWLSRMTVEEAEKYSAEGQFAPGSMLPKVQAAVMFAKSKKGRECLITSLDKAKEAMVGETGTVVSLQSEHSA